jgi:hypothetical protein
MATPSALLGHTNKPSRQSEEEADLLERSAKKKKGGEKPYEPGSSMPVSYADIGDSPRKNGNQRTQSYKDSVLGGTSDDDFEDTREFSDEEGEMSGRTTDETEFSGMEVIEKKRAGHECPDFVLTKDEENRIHKPWRNGVIVKLLWRRIGYKALETRLKQMWVRNGIINMVDVGNDFFLVTFTSSEDHYRALIDGPWMIYDNYLVVREWNPNFHPFGEVIEKVAVWVRFSGLPIEYYDTKMLTFIGNRIGRTVKVDRTTQTQARGKYARLCVEVDLTKPLLAMFQIKDRYYKVEYEGLHMLCLACGTFGHYKEGCVAKTDNTAWNGAQPEEVIQREGSTHVVPPQEGPWQVVQKNRTPRKKGDGGRQDGIAVNGNTTNTGSRYAILQENNPNSEEEANNECNDMIINTTTPRVKHTTAATKIIRKEVEMTMKTHKGDHTPGLMEKVTTDGHTNGPTPGARVNNREAYKRKATSMEEQNEAHMSEATNQMVPRGSNGDITTGNVNMEREVMHTDGTLAHANMGPEHYTRPPDIITGQLKENPILQRIDGVSEKDGNPGRGQQVTFETSIEIVKETPISEQGVSKGVDMNIDQ